MKAISIVEPQMITYIPHRRQAAIYTSLLPEAIALTSCDVMSEDMVVRQNDVKVVQR